ncbi:ABC-2 family transporter protein [Acididesulfobacillus acetoxydans]|uniref:ABC-2 family transporter protein n=1 Tax=Acididesulfobacillus acetoxydans TaxID=1561005 RepID=A0A8S0Y422_9FIRM|nr:ABC transporter permease [Acididesulfobacillus acetoxydans]CAA7602685.1 ABC-2 family transporter protein [Acididesulfobacillus acetoxydans]CEJ06458.1 ABC-type multidrug transport system, permease component [Acididesulfobacillus acetoxydans]
MIGAVLIKELRKLVREKGNFVYLLLMPMAFMILFHFLFAQASERSIKVNVLDADHSPISRQLVRVIAATPGFQVAELSGSANSAEQQVQKGKLSSVVIIPPGFAADLARHQPAVIAIKSGPQASASTGVLAGILQQIASKLADPTRPPSPVRVKLEQAAGTVSPSIATQIVPGYTVMFVFYIMITILRSLFKERQSGILERVRTTPLKAFQYMLGMWLPQVIAAMVQITALFAFGHWLLQLQLYNYGLLFLLSLALSLCATALGMMLTVLVGSENQGMALVQLVSLGGAALSGLWVPLDMLPAGMQTLAHFLPQYWAMQGYQTLLFHTGNLGTLWQGIGILTGIALVAILIAATRYNRFAKAESI